MPVTYGVGETKRPKQFFEYICDDPATAGRWRIISRKELTEEEIDRQLKLMVVSGRQRPPRGEIYTFKWPQNSINGE